MADTAKRKIDLVYDTIRAITNIAYNQEVLETKIQMLIDNGYASGGSDPLTDEELEAESDLAYLGYDKFAQAKDVSDELIALWAANSRAIEIKINQLRGLTGK